jgi:hypothetical protein
MPLNAERRRALTSTYKPRITMKEFINVNIRISRVQREYFEEAAEIAGFKSLNQQSLEHRKYSSLIQTLRIVFKSIHSGERTSQKLF